jgi:hypothetical protein
MSLISGVTTAAASRMSRFIHPACTLKKMSEAMSLRRAGSKPASI